MSPESGGPAAPTSPAPQRDFFDAYRVAIDDLHATKDLGQKIDSLYVTMLTLLLTADAYEIATTRFDNWGATAATVGVALIGLAVTTRWRQGASNLYQTVKNRYAWLRQAERRPDMARIGADIFTQEYDVVYLPQKNRRKNQNVDASQPDHSAERGFTLFYNRTVSLQRLCLMVFTAIPLILGAVTYLNLNPALVHAFLQSIQSR